MPRERRGIGLCGACGRVDASNFYPSNPWTCKDCVMASNKKHRTSEQRHKTYVRRKKKAFVEAARSREKNRDVINKKQRERRSANGGKLYDRLVCEARRTIGIPPSRMTNHDKEVLLHIRCYKLVASGSVTPESAKKIIRSFDSDPDGVLLSTFRYRVKPNVLKLGGPNGKQTAPF